MTDLRRALEELDAVDPDDAVFDRAKRGPTRPDPPRRGSSRDRVIAGITAIAVFALAGTFAWRAFDEREDVDRDRDTGVDVVPLGSDGSTLWPQRTRAELLAAQTRTDAGAGGFRWQLDRDEVVGRFAETVLGWPRDTYRMTLDESDDPGGTTIAHLERSDETCPPRTADDDDRGVGPCLPGAEDVVLVQPMRAGAGGVWVVRAVRSPTATIELEPGQVVTNADPVAAGVEIAQGHSAAWATVIGGFDRDRSCFGLSGAAPPDGDFEIDVRIEPDETAGTDCGTRVHGYVVVATAAFDLVCCGYVANPLNGDSSPFVSVTALPIVVTIPENEVEPGMNVYTDPLGWKVDLPEPWHVAPVNDVAGERTLTISNEALPIEADTPQGPDPSTFPSDLVVLEITQLVGDPSHEAAGYDAQFPLDPDLFRNPFQTTEAPVVVFQGNGLAYRARLFVGEEADDDVVASMLDVVRSLRFPSLASGTVQQGWMSLGNIEGYPIGRGTPAFMQRWGLIYVVHGTGGAYVLDLDPDGCNEKGGNQTWNRTRQEILLGCPSIDDVRYERDGTPIAGNPPGFTEPLDVYPAITAWDGTLLVSVTTSIDDVERYWPHG